MISKEAYILNKVHQCIALFDEGKEDINPSYLSYLIKRWSYDYEVTKEFRPEELTNHKNE